MPLLMKQRLVAAKNETTLGTDSAPTATDATMNAYDVLMEPTLEYIARMGQGSAARITGSIGKQHGTCTFKTPLSGNGAAASAGWLDVLLGGCGYIEATDTFSPNTAPPSTTAGTGVNHTLTIATYEDGLRKVIVGAMGTCRMVFDSGQNVVMEWTFTGAWGGVTDAAILAPTYDAVLPQQFRSAVLTIGGAAPGCVSNLVIDLGNTVELRDCATSSTGYETALITDWNVNGSWNPESRLVATEDVFGLWLAGTEEAFSLALTDGTDTITIAMPKVQRTDIKPGSRGDNQTDEITWQANRNAAAGDDQLTIDFS